MDFYSQYVSEMVACARNRTAYEEVIRYLMRITQYTGGREMAKKLAGEWIEKYPTRKVLVQELREWM